MLEVSFTDTTHSFIDAHRSLKLTSLAPLAPFGRGLQCSSRRQATTEIRK